MRALSNGLESFYSKVCEGARNWQHSEADGGPWVKGRLFYCGDEDACNRESEGKSERGTKDKWEMN